MAWRDDRSDDWNWNDDRFQAIPVAPAGVAPAGRMAEDWEDISPPPTPPPPAAGAQ